MRRSIEELIEASSLGSPGARAARGRTSVELASEIVVAARGIAIASRHRSVPTVIKTTRRTIMAGRLVKRTGKDNSNDITRMCGDGWSVSKTEAIDQIQRGSYAYEVSVP